MVHFRLGSTLLLAAACLLVTKDVSTERVITCDDAYSVQRLSCETGVIIVQAALYGRADREICSEGKRPQQLTNTKCSQAGTVDVLKKRCDGKRVCELNTNVVRTSDPCSGIIKYLEINYTCFPANHLVVCEHSLGHLCCDIGQVIHVYGADFGRRDQTTCSYQRPTSQVQNVYCSSPTSKVAESCNGRNSCTISASNSVFGDPCVGTYKYLEVAYTCLCFSRAQMSGGYDESTTKRVITCEGPYNIHRLSCETGVIIVQTALYGRADREMCSEGRPAHSLTNTECFQHGTLEVLKKRCDGKKFNSSSETPSSSTMLCPRLSNTLLLAATCLLINSGFSRAQHFLAPIETALSTERVITCDDLGNVHRLSCEIGVISVQAALYGRADKETCSEGRPAEQLTNTHCSQHGTLDVFKKRCDGKRVCELNTDVVRTSDPCYGIYKYLDTTFACFPAIRSVACEQSFVNLQCDEGQVIFVHGADYGRHDPTTCSYGRPASQIQNVQCSSPTHKVAQSCDGKSSCAVKASNSVFGDPCVGTYKYLEVAYSCRCM
ncbi:rhamnose-binding lectin [Lates calcarifer]|uniref:Rhamnose-binding lectin n=1 Tax=Lates calcarifer TaxID=8187 RepID=A0AAJ8DPR3_LATCA|nr:rhamnose-binding lectin [Lates calcarifer]